MGTIWAKSGVIERDNNDVAAPGAEAYFFQGATTTAQTVYQDAAETTPHTSPVETDANGRWPLVFVPFCTSFDVQVMTSGGTQLYYYRSIPNADPVEASVDSVADEELFATGDVKFRFGTGALTGYVRCNARTIGSAASGATERAHADTATLYAYLWNNFANSILAVSGGRGASASADFAANKTIALFDGRSATLRGLDDMGNTAASLLALATFTTGAATTGGSVCGVNTHTLTEAQLAAHTHTGTTGTNSVDHTHTGTTGNNSVDHTHLVSGNTGTNSVDHTHNVSDYQLTNVGAGSAFVGGTDWTVTAPDLATSGQSTTHTHGISITSGGESVGHSHTFTSNGQSVSHTHSFTTASTGSGTAHNNVSKSLLGTIYIKL